MINVFMEILNMSVTAGIVACAVIFIRLPLKKVPRIYSYALWAVVLFRLLCPFKLESAFSFLPASVNIVPQNIKYTQAPVIPANITPNPANNAINQSLPVVNSAETSTEPASLLAVTSAYIWLTGLVALIVYATFSYMRIKSRMRTAVLIRENIYETDRTATPFVLGFIRPQIYLPVGMEDTDYILKHEQIHIWRRDYLIKPVAFFALCLHWFNPVIWLSYFLMCSDMEMSCDENVLRRSGNDIRSDYSGSLLSLSAKQSGLLSPLAFGESNTKSRIKNVLSYKKPSVWISVAAILAVLCVTVGFLATRTQESLPWTGVALRSDWYADRMHFNRIYLGSERDYINMRMGDSEIYSDASMVHYYVPPVMFKSETGEVSEVAHSDYDVTIYFDDPTVIEKKGLRGVWRLDLIGNGEMAGVNGEDAGTLASVLREYGRPNKAERNGNIYTLWYYDPEDSDRRMWFEVENGELNRNMGIVCLCEGDGITANEAIEQIIGSLRHTDAQILFQIPPQYYKPYDWNIHISGHAEFEDGMSMSVHYLDDENERHAWEAGKWYTISTEGKGLTGLMMDVYLPDENGTIIEKSVDLLAAAQDAHFNAFSKR